LHSRLFSGILCQTPDVTVGPAGWCFRRPGRCKCRGGARPGGYRENRATERLLPETLTVATALLKEPLQ
jgi:hypothetical protein